MNVTGSVNFNIYKKMTDHGHGTSPGYFLRTVVSQSCPGRVPVVSRSCPGQVPARYRSVCQDRKNYCNKLLIQFNAMKIFYVKNAFVFIDSLIYLKAYNFILLFIYSFCLKDNLLTVSLL